MPSLTPLEIIKLTRSVQREAGASGLTALFQEGDDARASALARLAQGQAEKRNEEDDKSGWEKFRGAVGTAGRGALTGLDYLGSAGVSTLSELKDGIVSIPVIGKGVNVNDDPDPGELQNTGFNINDIIANTRNRVSGRAAVEENTPGATGVGADALGLLLDTAGDPLTYATLTPGRAAKEAANVIEKTLGKDLAKEVLAATRGGTIEAGDDIIRGAVDWQNAVRESAVAAQEQAAKDFVPEILKPSKLLKGKGWTDPLLSEFVPAALPDAASFTSLSDILGKDIVTDALRGGSDEAAGLLGDRLKSLTNRGGLGFAGFQSGIGQEQGAAALDFLRKSSVGKPLRNLFSSTAKVADELGSGVAEATNSAIHMGADAKRQAIAQLASNAPKMTDDIIRTTLESAAKDLREQIPNIVSDVAKDGYKPLADGVFVPDVIHDTIGKAFKMTNNDLAKAYDAGMGWVKSQITLNPALNPTGVWRNMFGNIMFAAAGGVLDPRQWTEAGRLRTALTKFAESNEGEFTEDAFRQWVKETKETGSRLSEKVLDDVDIKRATKMHEAHLAGRGQRVVDDVEDFANKAGQNKPARGTRLYSKALNWHEETARSAVFLKGIDDGLNVSQASRRARDFMLDYETAALTEFERDKLQRMVLFYKFPRRVLPMAAELVATKPGEAIALSRAGLGVAQGERNQYGEAIGGFLDTPLEAAFSQLSGIVSNKGGPVAGLLDESAPWVKFLLNDKERALEDVVPAIDSISRLINGSETSGPFHERLRSNTKLLIPGYKEGIDYAQRHADEDLAEAEDELTQRVTETLAGGRKVVGKDALMLFAQSQGIKDASIQDSPTLIDLLLAKKVPALSIGAIMLGEDPFTEASNGGFSLPDNTVGTGWPG